MSTAATYDEGYDAYWDGIDAGDNPYDEDTDERPLGKRAGGSHENTIMMRARGDHGDNHT